MKIQNKITIEELPKMRLTEYLTNKVDTIPMGQMKPGEVAKIIKGPYQGEWVIRVYSNDFIVDLCTGDSWGLVGPENPNDVYIPVRLLQPGEKITIERTYATRN